MIAMSNPTDQGQVLLMANSIQVPALLITRPGPARPGWAICVFPGDTQTDETVNLMKQVPAWGKEDEALAGLDPESPAKALTVYPLEGDSLSTCSWDWLTSAPLCAGLARAMLLRHTPHARADLAELWAANRRVLSFGEASDPLTPNWLTLDEALSRLGKTNHEIPAPFRTPIARRGRMLIAGLGSLGSVAARHLVASSRGLVMADPDRVDRYNPVRQAYPVAAIGQPKAQALRNTLLAAGAADVIALDTALVEEQEIVKLDYQL